MKKHMHTRSKVYFLYTVNNLYDHVWMLNFAVTGCFYILQFLFWQTHLRTYLAAFDHLPKVKCLLVKYLIGTWK
jgi:hypothetical protein